MNVNDLKVLNGIDMFATAEQLEYSFRNMDMRSSELSYWIDEAYAYFSSEYYPRKKKSVIEKFKLYTKFMSGLQLNADAFTADHYDKYAKTLMNMALLTKTENKEVNCAISASSNCLDLYQSLTYMSSQKEEYIPWLLGAYFDNNPERISDIFQGASSSIGKFNTLPESTRKLFCGKVFDVLSASKEWEKYAYCVTPVLIMYATLSHTKDDTHYKMLAFYWKSQQIKNVCGSIDDRMVLDNEYHWMTHELYGSSYKSLVETAKALGVESDYLYWKAGDIPVDEKVTLPDLSL